MSNRHIWNGKSKGSSNNCKGGLVIGCLKCGLVKEIINGIPTYFIDNTVYDKIAPKCDNRLKI